MYHPLTAAPPGAATVWRHALAALALGLLAWLALCLPAFAQAPANPLPASLLGAGVQQVATGNSHSCALTTAGTVQCWGSNSAGQLGDGSTTQRTTPTAVTGLSSGVAAIAAGGNHSCALTTAGTVQCWGYNGSGQLGDGSTTYRTTPQTVTGLTSGVAAIAAGDSHSCALTTAGAVQCWGYNGNGQLGDGSTTARTTPTAVTGLSSGVAAIAAGGNHSCALTTAGAVQCWGSNAYGQLGDGSTTARTTPTAVPTLTSGVAAIAAGGNHSCALTTAGAVQCWGYNYSGQLGDGSTTNSSIPQTASGLTSGVAAIAVGGAHNCALTTAGAVQCWGRNILGQLGDGSTTNSSTPQAVSGPSSGVAAIAAGKEHSCALTTAGAVQCWGYNGSGQLGDGSTTDRHTPTAVTVLANPVATIAAGSSHSCALTSAGAVQCWGNNGNGQLGDGTTTVRTTPTAVFGLGSGVAAIAVGAYYSCALTTTGIVQCWGRNDQGQLGDGSSTERQTPTALASLTSGVVAIAAGDFHSCALTSAGAVQCWGSNVYGQLGNGSTTRSHTPTAVSGLTSGVVAIATGAYQSCALTTTGAVQCWGRNDSGQLGNGSTTDRTTPTAVFGLGSGVAGIASGGYHSCALTSAGAVQCWGRNDQGQLGNGTTSIATPQTVTGLASGVAAISAGVYHNCALTTTGAVQCWGSNSTGQLGDGTTTSRPTPTTAPGLASGALAIAADGNHSCALTTTGAVQCWGSNFVGQLGDGSTTNRHTPTHIAASQALAFAPVAPTPLRAGTSTALSATASSALPVAFDTWTPNVCTVSGTTLSVLAGKANHLCGVRALQAGGTGAGGTRFIAASQHRQLLPIAAGVPGAPTALTPTAGDGAVALSWSAPAIDGGSAITGYTVTGSPGGSCTATPPATSCTVSGLGNGTAYTFSVVAHNAMGSSTPATAAQVTPVSVPQSLPLPGSAGNGSVLISGPAGCTVAPGMAFSSAVPANAPAGATAPLGVLRFTANGCTGATLSVAITYPAGSLAGLTPHKYGPASPGAVPGWFAHGAVSGDTVTYQVTDNGPGDSNPAPGVIEDPFAPLLLAAAPAPASAQAIPTLGEWGLVLLSLLAAALGAGALRRRGLPQG